MVLDCFGLVSGWFVVFWVVLDCFLSEMWLVWMFWGGIMLVLGW